ncbi:MAG: alpha/beta hydrolase [Oleibacter sp.]|nr:alpha/beta hydrolase [Thalassolituus sp.]
MNFDVYTPAALKAEPQVQMVNGYKVEFLSFSSTAENQLTPVMFLGGAFQTFGSFRAELESIVSDRPVILVDLPSQGSNDQLAPELNMADFADLIAGFLDAQNIACTSIMGVSYGSAMATIFASTYPEKVERLLISGITCFRRDSLIRLLEDSLVLLENGYMDAFATTAVSNLINHNRMDDTGISATYRRLLFRQVARLDDNERLRYAQNTRRLLRFEGFTSYPECETLIATGEYDNFTLPQENAAVAKQCKQGRFAVIRNADHLAQFEQKQSTVTVVKNFMTGQSIEGIEGVDVYDPQEFANTEQRLQPRHRPMEQPYNLVDTSTGKTHLVRLRDINFSGCQIELINPDMTINEGASHLTLEIPETGHSFSLSVLKRDKKTIRCLIMQRELKAADALIDYLENYFLIMRDNTGKKVLDHSKMA